VRRGNLLFGPFGSISRQYRGLLLGHDRVQPRQRAGIGIARQYRSRNAGEEDENKALSRKRATRVYVRTAVERDVIEASLSKSPSACSRPGPGRFPNDAAKRVGGEEGLPPLSYRTSNVGCAPRRSSQFSSGGPYDRFVSDRSSDLRHVEADSPCRVAEKNMIKNSRMRLVH